MIQRILYSALLLLCCSWFGTNIYAQNEDRACTQILTGDQNFQLGSVVITNGSAVNLRKSGLGGNYSTNLVTGLMVIGEVSSVKTDTSIYYGYWGQQIGPPVAPVVIATQGELKDRIQVSWAVDPLSSAASGGFKIFRDGVFMEQVDASTSNWNDFNVIAGRPYVYTIKAVNDFGEGSAGTAIGFQIPNGVATGWVQTINGSPVPDALVTLMPMQGFSAAFDTLSGAFAIADTLPNGDTTFLPEMGGDWTMTFWLKTDTAWADAAIMEFEPFPLYFQAIESAGGKDGIGVATTATGAPFLVAEFPDTTRKDWHHIAFALDPDDNQARLYLDGLLVDRKEMAVIIPSIESLNMGTRTDSPGKWKGKIDELRFYHRRLDELDLGDVKKATGSSNTPDLKYYWKFDEELGTKSFDILNRTRLYFCGAEFDIDRPPVRTAGITNSDGYYRIEGISYGTGTTFLAEPFKLFYMHRALEFNRMEEDTVTLPDFTLPPKATMEFWINSAGPDGTQSVASKKWLSSNFRLQLKPNGADNDVVLYMNGTETTLGLLGMGYQHLAFTIDSAAGTMQGYKNGNVFGGPVSIPASFGNWSDSTGMWVLGARESGGTYVDFFGGLIDEFAVYDSTLSQATILEHAQNERDPQEAGLKVYFAMDEGSGNRLNNGGSMLLDPGMTFGTNWTPLAANQTTEPHIFSPGTRQVTLNPSVTSVDQVDFTDRSTVAVTGFVRYKGTDCFAGDVEILVNGESYNPQIFTDSTGKFVIDFDPGTTAELTPVYENHQFEPASRFVINVVNPIAGLLFNDVTTRKISGQIAGGSPASCRKSIVSDGAPGNGPATDCRITVRTENGCYERTQVVENADGLYEFDNLPPLELTVAITKHNNLEIYTDFQTQGGRTIDLTQKDSNDVDFIYIAEPNVGVTGFDDYKTMCIDDDGDTLIVLDQYQQLNLDITVYEQYGPAQDEDDRCPLDTAIIVIDNTFDLDYDFIEPIVDSMLDGKYDYDFFVGNPNPNPPHLKIMQVTANVEGKLGTFVQKVLVQGMIKGDEKFTTQMPMVPNFVLRDPPGDGSSAYIEKGETICRGLAFEEGGGGGFYNEIEAAGGILTDTRIPFIGTKIKFKSLVGVYETLTATAIVTGSHSMQVCMTAEERIATDDSDLIVGGETSFDGGATIQAGNDIYVGTGFNLIFSETRKITYEEAMCSVKLENTVTANPDTFATTYMYSEWNIENNVIRYLDSLIASGDDLDGINTNSKEAWLGFIELNKKLKESAEFKRNISWDAGVEYEYAETHDTTKHWDVTTQEEIEGILAKWTTAEVEPGLAGLSADIKIGVTAQAAFSQGVENDTVRTMKVGYLLKDDDPADNWTMDVKNDPMFGTPVFDIIAGQTSCPWEVGTARREGVLLTSVDGNTRLGVPSNEKATFNFLLNNNSQTGETFTYALTAGPESNEDGAIILLNGAPMDHNVYYAIPWGEQIPVTITVERGPEEYKYFNTDVPPDHPDFDPGLEIVLFSECHDERSNALGFAPDFDPILYSAVYLRVEFEEPCSEVDIGFPMEGWVIKPDEVNPATQDELSITVNRYNIDDDDLEGIRLQYRPSDGNGAWINITDGVPSYIPKASLGANFTQYVWNTAGLADGPYEIRAVTVCSGGPSTTPGISHIIRGKIERQPPSLIGVPEPSDGVYHVGDEISFTFNKEINCDPQKLIAADITQLNNVGLYDATTGLLIDIDITCYENKIIIDPNFQNEFFENRILRAQVDSIEDLTGNTSGKFTWEFYVDRNELAWLTDSLGMTKYEDETKTVVAQIHNRGGYPVPFSIRDLPDWVHVVPDTGVLAANEIRDIRFEVDSLLAFGLWTDSITLRTITGQNPFFMGGDERLPLGVRVVCRPPNWDLNAGLYENTMNMALHLDIQGVVSLDEQDIVAAFIGDELRGRAYVEYDDEVEDYLAYLTIYGNPNDVMDTVRLEIWDASACLRYGQVQEIFTFQPDVLIGSPGAPSVVHTNSLILREVPLGFGWNWISFNLSFPDNSINTVLSSLNYPTNGLIKSQGPFSTYVGTSWQGSLTTLGNTSMYVYRTNQPDTLKMLGNLIDPLSTNLPIVSGWNWISYIPNYALPIDDALASLPAQPGDLIKSQYAFAEYLNNTHKWVGNLDYMQPPEGYQIRLANPGTLTYPPKPFTDDQTESRGGSTAQPISTYWSVDPAQFEFGMTLIGALEANGENITTSTMEIGAFVGDEVRGAATAIYIASIDAYQFFLTSYANTNGELLKFKLYDSETGEVQDLNETMYFSSDLHQGSVQDPVAFTLQGVSSTQEEVFVQSFDIQPNPFNTETTIRFTLPSAQDINLMVYDVSGREVSSIRTNAPAGLNVLTWNGMSNAGQRLNPGVYFVQLRTEWGSVSKRVVLQR